MPDTKHHLDVYIRYMASFCFYTTEIGVLKANYKLFLQAQIIRDPLSEINRYKPIR